MTRRLSQHDRDRRDLMALALLEQGLSQEVVCKRLGISRGPLVRLRRDIREDEAQ
jgi:transcriptional regulator with XRE-family HTH domain